MAQAHLLVIGDAVALAWVLREGRMAFPELRRKQVSALTEGDELFIYTTRSCYNNPGRDRGRVIGHATMTSPIHDFDKPLTIGHRSFTLGCSMAITGIAPFRSGVELAPLVSQLDVFPDLTSWSTRLRQPPLTLPATDADLIHVHLDPLVGPLEGHLPHYLERARA